MTGLSRYIFSQLSLAFVFATLVLTAAVWLSQSLRLVDLIVNRGLPLGTFLHMAMLTVPTFLLLILPVALFAAILFTYQRLTSDSELVVMRAAGFSHLQLARPALVMTLVVTGACYLFSLFLVPYSYREFKDLQYMARNNYSAIFLREGEFNALGDGMTVYVRERRRNGELLGILVHDSRDAAQTITLMAERGALVQGESGPQVLLINGNRQEVDKKGDGVTLLYFDRYAVDMGVLSDDGADRWREPRERYLPDLLFHSNSGDDFVFADKLVVEGHNRLSGPLYTVAFAVIALAAVLLGGFTRRGQAPRIFAAIGIMVVLQAVSFGAQSLAVQETGTIPLMYVLPLAAVVLGIWALAGRPSLTEPSQSFPPDPSSPPSGARPSSAAPAAGE